MSRGDDHWSIGEVLSLLQDEFPEVTISKIRFLESQGLINPERTASGYRRFYQTDFDRLQWILAQQRDHYLPLKVIRDRLESPDFSLDDQLDGSVESESEDQADDLNADDLNESASPQVEEATDSDETSPMQTDQPTPDDGAGLDTPAMSSETAAKIAAIETNQLMVTERRGSTGGSSPEDSDLNVALTVDELAEASGCTLEALTELERFNLLQGRKIGPTVLYDGEALLIARLAAQFSAYGLEPRHLRTLKIGAEREVGLLGQIVEPMLHRRDPETRRRAIDTFEDLVELAASLRAIMVRQMVREQLPSQRG